MITLFDALEHIKKEDVISFVAAIYGTLEDKGVLLLQVPNLQAPEGYLHRYNDITHEIGFIEHSLIQVLMSAGFIHYELFGFDDFVRGVLIDVPRGALRAIPWKWVRLRRIIDGNINPRILNATLCAAATKS